MDYETLLKILGPCGLNCSKCIAFKDGQIQLHSKALSDLLGKNFATYAETTFKGMEPAFGRFPAFKEILDFMAEGSCDGCRAGGCLFKECKLPHCTRQHEVDFCFQCPEYPCEQHGLFTRLEAIWRRNNNLMAEIGVEAFFQEIKDKPRYP